MLQQENREQTNMLENYKMAASIQSVKNGLSPSTIRTYPLSS